MALDVLICNKFDTNSGTYVCYKKNSTEQPTCFPPGSNSDPISLNNNEYVEITAEADEQGKNFQIQLKVIDGNPKVKIQRSDNKWKLINDGANTSVQVGAGPDGQ
jgi:hypothetical protein